MSFRIDFVQVEPPEGKAQATIILLIYLDCLSQVTFVGQRAISLNRFKTLSKLQLCIACFAFKLHQTCSAQAFTLFVPCDSRFESPISITTKSHDRLKTFPRASNMTMLVWHSQNVCATLMATLVGLCNVLTRDTKV